MLSTNLLYFLSFARDFDETFYIAVVFNFRLTAIRLFGPDPKFAPVNSNPAHWVAKMDIDSILSSIDDINPLDKGYITSPKANILKRVKNFKCILFPYNEEQLWFDQALKESGIKITPQTEAAKSKTSGFDVKEKEFVKVFQNCETEEDVLVWIWWIGQEISRIFICGPRKRTAKDIVFCKSSGEMLKYLNEKLLALRLDFLFTRNNFFLNVELCTDETQMYCSNVDI